MKLTSFKNWKTSELNEVIDLIIDHRGLTPLKLGGNWTNSGYRALSAKNIKTGEMVQDVSARFVNESLYKKWMPIEIENGDILLTSEGPLGEYFLWSSDEKIVLSQRLFGIRTNKKVLDSKFFYYLLGVPFYRGELFGRATGTTVEGIRQSELLKTKVIYPESIEEQKEIAEMLGSLDDKIDLLRKENKTLENIAQTLFKEWFVDFNFPGSIGKMIDSELGEIPEGWRVGKLGDVVEVKGGTTPSTTNSNFWNGGIHWTSPKDLSDRKDIFLLDTDKKITEEGLKEISSGLLPKGTLLLSSRAPIGYLALTNIDLAINQGYIAMLPGCKFQNYFMYLWIKYNMQDIIGASNGSTFLEISKTSFKNLNCVIPKDDVLLQFTEAVTPQFEKMKNNVLEVKTLSKLRDELLNKIFGN